MTRWWLPALVCLGIGLCLASSALADDRALVRAYGSGYPAAEAAAAHAGDPDGAYEAARNLQEAVRASWPVSASCRTLHTALGRYADARVLQIEGIDRPSAADVARGRRTATALKPRIAAGRRICTASGRGGAATVATLSPAPGEAFFGSVVARVPTGAESAQVFDGGTPGERVAVTGPTVRFDVSSWSPGPHDLRVVFRDGARVVATGEARAVQMLPASAGRAAPGSTTDGARSSALARVLAGGPRYRSAWIQDLSTGATAGVNASAVFPAASTVKLGLMVGTLARLGARPETSRYAHDLQAIAGWSSNLASNRLVRHFGVGTAQTGLRRLGARQSTFTGEYIAGTELQPALPAAPSGTSPPRTSRRVTTAQDLGRMLYGIHASAVSPVARRETGLTQHQARMALGWLLTSQQRGDNASLLAAGAPAGAPIAQKNGWLRAAHHAAGIVYAPTGPVIVVVMTYDEGGVSLADAQALGARVARITTS